jgi:hypothetical protein
MDRLYIVDNHSSDGTLKILERLAAERLSIKVGRDECAPYSQLVPDPVERRGGPLQYGDQTKSNALPRVLEFTEQIARQLGQANPARSTRGVSTKP